MNRLVPTLILAVLAGAGMKAVAAVDPGREGMLFSRLGGDARGSSLGSPGGALSEGRSALFANPAGAILARDYSFVVTHLAWVEGFFGETVSSQIPLGFKGVLGLSVFVFTHEAIPVTSEALPDGTGGLADVLDLEISILGAQWVTDETGVGASLRLLNERLGEETTNGFAVDVGGVHRASPDFTLGVAVRGLGQEIRADAVRDPVPLLVCMGVRYEMPVWPARAYVGGQYSGYGLSSGGVAIEVGERTGSGRFGAAASAFLQMRERTGLVFGMGAGVRIDMWVLDYTFSPVSSLGFSHRFSLGIRFAAPRQR